MDDDSRLDYSDAYPEPPIARKDRAMSLGKEIEKHFEMLMPLNLQQWIGVDDNGVRSISQRVMRVIQKCTELSEKVEALDAAERTERC